MNIAGCSNDRGIPSISLYVFTLLLISITSLHAQSADGSTDRARTTIHMLDYMAADYPVAVKNGQIINEMEFREMKNFAVSIDSLYRNLGLSKDSPDFKRTARQIDSLHQLVLDKVSADQIARTARDIKQQIIEQTSLTVTPRRWPNMQRGKQIYVKRCASCHGKEGRGDGPAAPNLDPPPTNFHDDGRMSKISPFQAYNTIQLGVSGTSMRAYTELTDLEAWSLSFYIKNLRFADDTVSALPESSVDSLLANSELNLSAVAKLSDRQLKDKIRQADTGVDVERGLQGLRQYQPAVDTTQFLSKASHLLDKTNSFYSNGEYQKAYQSALSAYLEGYEPVEAQLSAHDAKLMRNIENDMITLRSRIQNRVSADELDSNIASLQQQLDEARTTIEDSETTAWLSFLLSSTILLREGLEAFLIIITILSILTSLNARREKIWIHAGWIAAVALGLAGWFFADWLMDFNASRRELMEGGLSLFAVLILIYVGFWMHSKSEAKQWKEFIDNKIRQKLHGGNLFGLFIISFIAVFREAFESVIFLSAISLEAGPSGNTAIGFGAVTAFILLAIIGYAVLKLTIKVPLRSIFRYGSYAIGFFAFIMVGQGIHAVQESGFLTATPTQLPIHASLIGVYPTWETLTAQLITTLLLLGLWKYSKIRG